MLYRDLELENLEREYSPSSCIEDINIFIKEYIERSKDALIWAQQLGKVETNISYGNNVDEQLDLFLPTQGNSRKLQVYIHGGYWQELSKNESSFAANNFQQHGCYYAVLNYSLAPNATMTEIVAQNCKAIAWLYNNAERFGFDKNEIYISGSSAGAHLALMVTQMSGQYIQGVCAVSGIYDIRPIALTYINEPLQLTDNEIEQYSPLFCSKQLSMPMIYAVGENETNEFKRQSQEMADKHNSYSQVIKSRNHFDVILDLADEKSWLCKQVFEQMGLA
ncbi:alpha/beta hydrolase [Thalassotalea crassostreae]|uniref:alpha/beta hydrolase n=1 Tax=Thalassotalea crassostreae TaxID=1763536 RepID=UPI0008380D22|nr:alpha/beta hydrolase [Thalassotalea crassostreae]